MALDKAQVVSKVAELVAKQLNREIDDVTEDKTFADLGADSLDIAELVMEIEDAFDVKIPEDADIKSVGQTVEFILKHGDA